MNRVAPGGVANAPFQNVTAAGVDVSYDVPDYDPANGIPPNNAAYSTRPLHPPDRLYPAGQVHPVPRGVDLNRNCRTEAYGYDLPPDYFLSNPATGAYFGSGAGSEVETANIEEFLANRGAIAASIDYHSYGKKILLPPEASHNGAVGPDYQALGDALQLLIRPQGPPSVPPDYQLGTPLQAYGFDATGSLIDHMAREFQARAFSIELDPAWDGGSFDGFMLPEDQIITVFEKNIRGALAAISAPRPAGTSQLSVLRRSTKITKTTVQFLRWNVYGRGNGLPA
jgi:hypothetical protein